jgi:hypothetical protein
MATRLTLHRNLHRVLSNFTVPTVADINNAMTQVLNMLFAQYCRRVDTAGDCIVAPALPATDFKTGGKYVDEVIENAYVADDFLVALRYPTTDLLIATLKPNVVMPIVGFYIEFTWYPVSVTRINIYRNVDKTDLWKSVNTMLAGTFGSERRGVVTMLPEPLIVGPGGEIAIETVTDSTFTPESISYVRTKVVWLPPVVFTSRSLFVAPSSTP